MTSKKRKSEERREHVSWFIEPDNAETLDLLVSLVPKMSDFYFKVRTDHGTRSTLVRCSEEVLKRVQQCPDPNIRYAVFRQKYGGAICYVEEEGNVSLEPARR